MRSCKTANQSGYSLVELLVVMAVSVVLIGALYSVLFQSQVTQEAQQDLTDLRQQARVVLTQIADELRMAGYDLGSATERLTTAGASSIAFVGDLDDGDPASPCGAADESAVGGGAERVTYRIQGTDLLRSVDCWDGAGWGNEYTDLVIARDVQSAQPLFLYFDEVGNQLDPGGGTLNAANRDLVRIVEINLSLAGADVQALGEPNVDFQLETSVRLRNAGG
jgi:prepilin-type N-terminal cleavage/methylation domain-containing protein